MGAAVSCVRTQHQVRQGPSWHVRGWLVWHVVLQPRLLLWLLWWRGAARRQRRRQWLQGMCVWEGMLGICGTDVCRAAAVVLEPWVRKARRRLLGMDIECCGRSKGLAVKAVDGTSSGRAPGAESLGRGCVYKQGNGRRMQERATLTLLVLLLEITQNCACSRCAAADTFSWRRFVAP